MSVRPPCLLLFVAIAAAATSARVAAEPPTPQLPFWWNPCFNCYNHAVNSKAVNFAQPGGGGRPFTCANVRMRANADGLLDVGPVPWVAGTPVPSCPAGQCLIALAVRPDGSDYHWYRLNQDGVWSHKPGQTCARPLLDAGGAPSTNPETAARGTYGTFCGYFCVPDPGTLTLHAGRAWTVTGTSTDCFLLTAAGIDDPALELTDLAALESRLPSGPPIPDPQWQDLALTGFGGFALRPRQGYTGPLPEYLRVFDGVVAIYTGILSDNVTITYYADDRGLGAYLASAHRAIEIPTLSKNGVTGLSILLFAAAIAALRRRARGSVIGRR